MSIKLIAIDMDDTLLRSDKTYEEERFQKIYEALREKDIILAIASGNIYPRLNDYFSHMEHRELYFAGDNGNFVVKNEEVLHKTIMDDSEVLEAVERLEQTGKFSVILCDGIHTYSTGIDEENEDYILGYYPNLEIVDSHDDIPTDEFVKVASHSTLSLDEIKTYADKVMENHPAIEAVTSGGGWFDFYHHEGGKGTAVKALQEKYDVSPEETMVFGDSLNDSSMMDYAKYSVAVSNADDELKEICSYEIGSNDDQAVLDVLEKFLETESIDFMEEYRKKS